MEKEMIKNIRVLERTRCEATIDEDYVIRDYKPDADAVIFSRGEAHMEETKLMGNTLWLSGIMHFNALYKTESKEEKVDCVEGDLPFQEKVMLDGAGENVIADVAVEVIDLDVLLVNSRKLVIRAIVAMSICIKERVEEEILCAEEKERLYEENAVSQEFYSLTESKADILRIEAQTMLAPAKPNIRKVLWYGVEVNQLKSYPRDGVLCVEGELCATVLYQTEEEEQLCWSEHQLSVEGKIRTEQAQIPDLYWAKAVLSQADLIVENDADGEPRRLQFHLAISLQYEYWKCKRIQMLVDAYALEGNLKITKQACKTPVFLMKNIVLGRLCEHFRIGMGQHKILQICYCRGTVLLDEVKVQKDALEFRGVLGVHVLYMTAEDQNPVSVIETTIPFVQRAELENVTASCDIRYDVKVEQIQVNLLDSSELEIKAQLECAVMAFGDYEGDKIVALSLEDAPKEQTRLPAFVGYMVQEGERAWDIAKRYQITERELLESNGKKGAEIQKGDKLLIVRKRTKCPL